MMANDDLVVNDWPFGSVGMQLMVGGA